MIFIIFSDFLMFYQILFSPQVNSSAIVIVVYHAIYEFPDDLLNDLRPRTLGN